MEKRELALAAPGKRELRVRVSDELYEGLKELQNQASGSLLTKWLSAGHAEELDYEYLETQSRRRFPMAMVVRSLLAVAVANRERSLEELYGEAEPH